ncbi:MAG: FAD-dependent oxidoreductase [Frankiales bacterium]|nr:MAG: FAD-dependent oxidoreductase [Frankiales bacterium]
MTVAVVGAGISGAACARALQEAGVGVTLLDRGRVPGGRLASRRIDGRPVDLGASYLTCRDARFSAVVDDWCARGLAHPWTDAFHEATPAGLGGRKTGPVRFGTPGGMRSLVADLLAPLEVTQQVHVSSVGPGPVVDGRAYDAVVLAMPDPQALPLLVDLPHERAQLVDRAWEPVLALAARFPARTWDLDGCFVAGSDVLGWIADDGRRRGDGAPVLVAHSTSALAAGHLADPSAAGPELLDALRSLLGIPVAPEWSFVQRWTYARPVNVREMPYWLGDSGVSLCGDGWGSPRVETAWLSGHLLGQALAARLG